MTESQQHILDIVRDCIDPNATGDTAAINGVWGWILYQNPKGVRRRMLVNELGGIEHCGGAD